MSFLRALINFLVRANMEKHAYSRSSETCEDYGTSGGGGSRKASSRTKPRPQRIQAAAAIVLNERQYEHFYECMTKPEKPSQALQEGAKLLERLRRK